MRSAWLGWLVFLCAVPARADAFAGWIGVGGEGDGSGPAEARFEARLQYETKRYEGFEAIFEVSADATSRDVEIKDAYVDKRFESEWRLRFGRGKKIVGWEYEDSTRERLSLERSAVYRFMAGAGLVGRDYFLSARYDAYRASLHYNEAGDAGLILSARAELSSSVLWGGWVLVQRDQYRQSSALSWTAATGPRVVYGRHRGVIEAFVGTDPLQSELEAAFGDGRTVYFLSGKVEYAVAIASFAPYVQGVALLADLEHAGRETLQGLFGLRYDPIPSLVLAGEVELFGDESVSLATGTIWKSPFFRVEVRYYWP